MIHGMVAIVGRPNVGKSTIFNVLTRTRDALVDDQPGVTRDRIYGTVEHSERFEDHFWVIDTGGFETKNVYYQPFADNIVWEQTEAAIESADIVLFVLDGQSGLHPHDKMLAQFLREKNKPVIYAVNKIDNAELDAGSSEFYALGAPEFWKVSAAHSRGIGELREKLSLTLDALRLGSDAVDIHKDSTKVALVGRPNVGKSSVLNRLVGENRALVSDVAGTTRDAIDTPIQYNQHQYVLIDTAGIRKKSKVKDKLEVLSVIKSLRAIERADIVILIVDAIEGFGEQEARIASIAMNEYKSLMIVVNKWDLVENKSTNMARDMAEAIRSRIKDMAYVPVIFISCMENQRVFKILKTVEALRGSYGKRVGTAEVNRAMEKILAEHTPALSRRHNKRWKFYYATQIQIKPPTFVVKCNLSDEIQESYKRYMTHRLRELLGFESSPLRVWFRPKNISDELS